MTLCSRLDLFTDSTLCVHHVWIRIFVVFTSGLLSLSVCLRFDRINKDLGKKKVSSSVNPHTINIIFRQQKTQSEGAVVMC